MQPDLPALPLLRISQSGRIYYHSQQSCRVEALNPVCGSEEAGLSSRCVTERIKCLVSAKGAGSSSLSFLKGTDGCEWLSYFK